MNMLSLTLAQQGGPLTRLIFGTRGASDLARDTDYVFMWILWFCIIWFVFLMGLMTFWVIKYRRRPGVPMQRSPHHNTKLELAWTILPSVFLGYMFYIGLEGYLSKLVAPTNAETIDVVGTKWDWLITYDNGANPPDKTVIGGKPDAPVILIPVGRPVQFRMTSRDVLHSFWIPDFRFKFDVIPNRYTSFWIEAEEPGEHIIFCAEYCGDKHSEMLGQLVAVPAEEYDRLKASWTVDLSLPPVQLGEMIAKNNGCLGCHTTGGGVSVGSTWHNAWGNEVPIEGSTNIPADDPLAWDNYIVESITNPTAKIHQGFPPVMTSYAGVFDERELSWLVAYITSLSEKAAPPAQETPPADEQAEQEDQGEDSNPGEQ